MKPMLSLLSFIDGKIAGVASNHGFGGPTQYYGINKDGDKLIKKAEQYCKICLQYIGYFFQ
jgi:hypothetical protein